jgi:hypothetical protein
MAFLQCTDSRAEIIRLLIDRDLEALQNDTQRPRTFLDLRAKSGNSVYMEHEQSRAPQLKKFLKFMANKGQGAGASKKTQALTANAAKKATAKPTPKDLLQNKLKPLAEPNGGTDKLGSNVDAGDDGLDDLQRIRLQKRAEEARKKAGETRIVTPIAEEARRPGEDQPSIAGRHDEPAPNTPKRRTTGFNNVNLDAKSEKERVKKEKTPASVKPSPTGTQGQGGGTRKMFELLEVSDATLLRLKLHYMRTRSAEMVISFLYGTNIDGESLLPFLSQPPPDLFQFLSKSSCIADAALKMSRSALITTNCPPSCHGRSSSGASAKTKSTALSLILYYST